MHVIVLSIIWHIPCTSEDDNFIPYLINSRRLLMGFTSPILIALEA